MRIPLPEGFEQPQRDGFMIPRFDPTRAVVFDLAAGQLRDDEGAFRLNVPLHLLARLLEEAGETARADFARGLGEDVGRRVRQRMGEGAEGAQLSAWTEHLGGQLALLGLGNLRTERWGRALVLRIEGIAPEAQALVPAVLEGAMHRGLGREVRAVSFTGLEGESAFLIVSPETAGKVQSLAAAGEGLGSVVEKLHGGLVKGGNA